MFRPLAPLWPFVQPHLGRVAAAEVAGLLAALADAGLIALLARFLEAAAAGRDPALFALALLLVVARVTAARAQGTWHGQAAATVRAGLRVALHERLLRLPLAALRAREAGDLSARVFHDAPLAAAFVFEGAPQALVQALRTVVLLLAAAHYHPPTAGLALVAALPLLLVASTFGRRSAKLYARLANGHAAVYQATEDALRAPEALRAFRAAGAEARRFAGLADALARTEGQLVRALASSDPVAGAIAATLLLAVVWQGQADVAAARATIGELAAAVAAAAAALAALRGLVGLHSQAQQGLVAARRVAELLAAEQEPVSETDAPTPFARAIAFEVVGFAYPGRAPLLSAVSWELRRGERLAIVGETGGGKTTLLRLLLRLERPGQGRVTIDGVDAESLPQGAYRALFGLVPQDAQLLARSLEENVRLGRDGVPPAEVVAATEAAGLGPLIARLPAGSATGVGASGTELSGGERLEVALARALLGRPEILVLDEVTAGLDALAEQRALAAIGRASAGRTLLLVTHRLSTARLADRVLVLEGGRVVEQGAFDALVATEGPLRRMWEAQGRPGHRGRGAEGGATSPT